MIRRQTSPFEVVFGRIPRLPLELELGLALKDPVRNQNTLSRLGRYLIKDVREVARQNLKKARKKQRKCNEERIQTWMGHIRRRGDSIPTQTERMEIGGEVDWAI